MSFIYLKKILSLFSTRLNSIHCAVYLGVRLFFRSRRINSTYISGYISLLRKKNCLVQCNDWFLFIYTGYEREKRAIDFANSRCSNLSSSIQDRWVEFVVRCLFHREVYVRTDNEKKITSWNGIAHVNLINEQTNTRTVFALPEI